MEVKTIFQTSVLSKQWKDLWKSVTYLSLNSSHFRTVADFNKFVSHFLSNRDDSISLLKLFVHLHRCSELKLLNRMMKYAVLHKVERLAIEISCLSLAANNKFPPSIFSSPSISFLWLFVAIYGPIMKLPPSLQLPALTTLSLHKVCFTAGDNDCAEPFSSCKLLKTLFLNECSLHDDAKRLWISNSSLAKLTLHHSFTETYKLVLSTPNLSFLSVTGNIRSCYGEVSSTCNLSFLEEGNIGARYSIMSNWLQLFANVKKLTLFGIGMENILSVRYFHNAPEIFAFLC
uniref:F-box/LRR-repeat protein At4g13965 family n=1 Tax=Cajanus cajan TaxID=3821 RepID=A0A151RHD4_CAJCA|nr:Putative F-box/LRR-repeat protein At4g13965 family [Cajanus cajan]